MSSAKSSEPSVSSQLYADDSHTLHNVVGSWAIGGRLSRELHAEDTIGSVGRRCGRCCAEDVDRAAFSLTRVVYLHSSVGLNCH